MYSREEAKKIRQEFWISFGMNYPRKWILYNTRIKDLSLKFDFNREYAEVSMEVGSGDDTIRQYYFEKLQSLHSVLTEEYIPDIIFAENFEMEGEKIVSKIYVREEGVNIYNKNDWEEVQEFLSAHMSVLEDFFLEYGDFISE